MADLTVELVCKAEDLVVGSVMIPGKKVLSAFTISRGLKNKDVARVPDAKMIMDGVQMTCRRCHSNLYFRDAVGTLLAAMPGSVEFLDDPVEEEARERRAVVRARQEEAEAKADQAAGRRSRGGAR